MFVLHNPSVLNLANQVVLESLQFLLGWGATESVTTMLDI